MATLVFSRHRASTTIATAGERASGHGMVDEACDQPLSWRKKYFQHRSTNEQAIPHRSLYVCSMALSLTEYRDLLDEQGRVVVHGLGRLSPDAEVPPLPLSALAAAEDHWGTLEIWARSLENPAAHWSELQEVSPPQDYAALVAAIATEYERLSGSLTILDADVGIDYFDRRGTVAEAARLLAHEATVMAHAACMAAGLVPPVVAPEVASDGIDQTLRHWSSAERVERKEKPVAMRCTDTGDAWHLALNGTDSFRLAASTDSVVRVEGSALDVLWWLHGHPSPEGAVTLEGDKKTMQDLLEVLMIPEIESPNQKRGKRFWLW